MTLKELAIKVGCSESMLSKIENGRATPSLPMLNRLAGALGIALGSVFANGEGGVFRSAPSLPGTVDGVGGGALTMPSAVGRLLRFDVRHLAVGAEHGAEASDDGETAGYVLDGTVDLVTGDGATRLTAGDSFVFPSTRSPGCRNVGTMPARILWIRTTLPT